MLCYRLISYVARHVIKCVAVIEKVNYLKNHVFLPMYIPSWYSWDSGQLHSSYVGSFSLSLYQFFHIPAGYASKHHLNFMLVPEVQHCQSNSFFLVSWYLFIIEMHPLIIDNHEKWHSESVHREIPVYICFLIVVLARNTTKFDLL